LAIPSPIAFEKASADSYPRVFQLFLIKSLNSPLVKDSLNAFNSFSDKEIKSCPPIIDNNPSPFFNS
jgi:hypothetical protein